jgi:hypothetical protein
MKQLLVFFLALTAAMFTQQRSFAHQDFYTRHACVRQISNTITCADGSTFTYKSFIFSQAMGQIYSTDQGITLWLDYSPAPGIPMTFQYSTALGSIFEGNYSAQINKYIFSGDPCVTTPTINPLYTFAESKLCPDPANPHTLWCPPNTFPDYWNHNPGYTTFSDQGFWTYVSQAGQTDWNIYGTGNYNDQHQVLHCCDPIPQDPEVKDVVTRGFRGTCVVKIDGKAYLKLTVGSGVGSYYNSTISSNTGHALYLYYLDPTTNTWNYTAILPSSINAQTPPSTDYDFYYLIPQGIGCYKYFIIGDGTNPSSSGDHHYDHFIDVPFDGSDVATACPCCKADFAYLVNTDYPTDVTVWPLSYDPAYTYEISMGDGATSTGISYHYQYPTPGKYTICVQAKSEDGDICTKCMGICVGKNIRPEPCGADFTFEIFSQDPLTALIVPNTYNPTYVYDLDVIDTDPAHPATPTTTTYYNIGSSIFAPLLYWDHTYEFCLKMYYVENGSSQPILICERCFQSCPLSDIIPTDRNLGRKAQSAIKYTGEPQLKVYPNPASDYANLEFSVPEEALVNIEVKDALGKTVYEQRNTKLSAGKQTINLPTQSLASGLYHVIANSGKWSITKRLSVIK